MQTGTEYLTLKTNSRGQYRSYAVTPRVLECIRWGDRVHADVRKTTRLVSAGPVQSHACPLEVVADGLL